MTKGRGVVMAPASLQTEGPGRDPIRPIRRAGALLASPNQPSSHPPAHSPRDISPRRSFSLPITFKLLSNQRGLTLDYTASCGIIWSRNNVIPQTVQDRKSTRLNSSHLVISY